MITEQAEERAELAAFLAAVEGRDWSAESPAQCIRLVCLLQQIVAQGRPFLCVEAADGFCADPHHPAAPHWRNHGGPLAFIIRVVLAEVDAFEEFHQGRVMRAERALDVQWGTTLTAEAIRDLAEQIVALENAKADEDAEAERAAAAEILRLAPVVRGAALPAARSPDE